ncbi:CCA-adding enzyme [Ferrimicrobium acidiphilum DSM 19497]|uniref:CCA-adding enzyme n=1 Tax=Ferrimicrobium acidiphilum DSM 19497 TaxID=1121877 RepID=A0A0D8FT47_9ACTN|nr:CCA-adding enzyme [Ferrimicrobium acidiphilum DSM 19497]
MVIPNRFAPTIRELKPVVERFAERGFHLYLVGGIVRDLLLGPTTSDVSDVDLTTDAEPNEILTTLAGMVHSINRAGERFGTIACSLGSTRLEITTHRAEAYATTSRKPEVRFSTSLADDLARRDFTINAIAIELTATEPLLIDPYNGVADLVARRLATPLSADISFGEDPLRMLRAARFIARFDLTPAEGMIVAIEKLAPRLDILSRERIRDELSRLLVLPDPTKGLQLLVDTPLAINFLPALASLRLEQDPVHHHKDVLAHTIAVVQKCSPRLRLRLAALLHDIAKPKTRAIGPDGVTFHFHDVVGARMATSILTELRYPKDLIGDVSKLVGLHLRFHGYDAGWTDSAVRRYVRDAGDLYEDLNELTVCDATTRNQYKLLAMARRMDEFKLRVKRLQEADALASLRPALDGTEIMTLLQIPPSKPVGRALAFLMETELEEGPISKEEAIRRVLAWWEQQSHKL